MKHYIRVLMEMFGIDINYQLVEYFLVFLFVFYIAFEVFLNLNQDEGDTTNVILLDWSKGKSFFIPFALGAVVGHLFLGTKMDILAPLKLSPMLHSMVPVIALFVLCGIMLFIGYKISFTKSRLFLAALLGLGILYGHLFWTMSIPT